MSLTETLVWWGSTGLTTAGGLVSVGLLALFYFQRRIIYPADMPPGSRKSVPKPLDFHIVNYEDLQFKTSDDINIRGYLLKQHRAKDVPTLMYFHANAGNMGHRLPIAALLYNLLGCNVFLLSYRGYGLSEGNPSEHGFKLDVDAAIALLKEHPDIDEKRLLAFGQSIGGAVAINTVSRYPDNFRALIVENSFTSLPQLIPKVMPFLRYLTLFVLDKWDSEASIRSVKCPALFLSGQSDELIPPSMMLRLFQAAGTPDNRKELVTFAEGTHNDTTMQPGFFQAIETFYRRTFFTASL